MVGEWIILFEAPKLLSFLICLVCERRNGSNSKSINSLVQDSSPELNSTKEYPWTVGEMLVFGTLIKIYDSI